VAYELSGRGRPLVLLHAFPFDRRIWRATAAALSKQCQVIVPDLRGFGASRCPSTPFSIADLADDVAALLDRSGLEKATVAGLSMGGYVALAFAARHPQRLERLILADTFAGADSPETRQAREEAIALVQTQGVAAYVDRQRLKLLRPSADEALWQQVRVLAQQPAQSVVTALAALRDRPDRRAELRAIAVPTLVIVGAEDALTPPSVAQAMAAEISGAQFVTLPGAGHLANLEVPSLFSSAISTFLSRTDPVDSA
jgi:3-oxoadipate enol-lactonase